MSILYENDYGFLVSHVNYINTIYIGMEKPLKMNSNLFNINVPYKSSKRTNSLSDSNKNENFNKEQTEVRLKFDLFLQDFMKHNTLDSVQINNKVALETSDLIYNLTGRGIAKDIYGANIGPATIKTIQGFNYVFPQNSKFYSKDILEIKKYLTGEKYDLILMDPPWWNKYIRRKRKKSEDVYKMLFNNDIKDLPVETLLKDNGLVVVWCTNSQQHINDLLTKIFPKWNVKYIGKWYWMKITSSGKPICEFSPPPRKQPYEQIIFGCRGDLCSIPSDGKLIVSIPSALHSHKPPLVELIKKNLPDNPLCLEIFARYLLPNWTSYGNEVLRFQHESLFL